MKEVIPNSAAVRLALSGSRYVDVASMPWNEPVPGLRMKVLYKDNEAKEAMVLVEAKPCPYQKFHLSRNLNIEARSKSRLRSKAKAIFGLTSRSQGLLSRDPWITRNSRGATLANRKLNESGSDPIVAVMQAPDFWDRDNLSDSAWLNRTCVGAILVERKMSAGALVIVDVRAEDATQMALVEDQDVIQTLAAN